MMLPPKGSRSTRRGPRCSAQGPRWNPPGPEGRRRTPARGRRIPAPGREGPCSRDEGGAEAFIDSWRDSVCWGRPSGRTVRASMERTGRFGMAPAFPDCVRSLAGKRARHNVLWDRPFLRLDHALGGVQHRLGPLSAGDSEHQLPPRTLARRDGHLERKLRLGKVTVGSA